MAILNPRAEVTALNAGPVLSIVAWVLIAAVVLAVLVKLLLSSLAKQRFLPEDAAIVTATVFSIGHVAAISVAVANGIGKQQDATSPSNVVKCQKARYAGGILLVLTVSSAQLSILLFINQITPVSHHIRLLKCMGMFIVIWTVCAFFAAVFSCNVPQTWAIFSLGCYNLVAFWRAYGVLNALIECALIVLPVYIVLFVKMQRTNKAIVMGCFAARILVIAAFIMLAVQTHTLRHSSNETFASWPYFLCAVVAQSLSVVCGCIPQVRSLLMSLQRGMMATGHFRLGGAGQESVQRPERGRPSSETGGSKPGSGKKMKAVPLEDVPISGASQEE